MVRNSNNLPKMWRLQDQQAVKMILKRLMGRRMWTETGGALHCILLAKHGGKGVMQPAIRCRDSVVSLTCINIV